MFSGHGSEVLRFVGPRQEGIDVAVGMTVDDPGKDVGQIAKRIDVVEFAGFDQRSDSGPVLGAAVGAGEQCIIPVQRDRADGPFDGVVVELDAAVVEEPGEALPARQGVADGLAELALLADQPEFCAQPWLQCVDQRAASLLPNDPTLVGAAAADVLLDHIQRGNALKRFAGDRRRSGRGELVEVAPHMHRTHPRSAVLSDAWYFAKRVTLSLALRSSGDAGRDFGRVGAAAALVAG